MKKRIIKIGAVLTLTLTLVAWSPPTGEDLIVGDSNTTSSPGGYLGVVGNSNTFNAKHSIALGQNNSVPSGSPTTSCSFVAGFNNQMSGGSGAGAFAAAAIGEANQVTTTDGGCAIGYSNKVTANLGIAIGTGTTASVAKGTALGRYNNGMVSDDVLVVGTGADDQNRVNSMKIKSDGTILLGNSATGKVILARAQGDISMGIYGN